jgi:hypothetical protein
MTKDYSRPATKKSLETTKQALEEHGFNVHIVDTLVEAKQKVLSLVPKGVEVFTATSVTLDNADLTEALNGPDYISLRDIIARFDSNANKIQELRRIGSVSDYTIGSVHAITEDGQAVIVSATGSQLPNYAYGAGKVVWVVGSQKIVKDMNDAFERIQDHVFPLESERALKAYGMGSVISRVLLYTSDPQKRVTIVIVKEAAGF